MLRLSPEIAKAKQHKLPIVALESTIIAHGLPYPQNLDMALEVSQIIRDRGAVPATIAVVNGELAVGLEDELLTELAKRGPAITKLSSRDLPYAVARSIWGATTVASTMRIAALAEIDVFATGGIGGVHRGAEINFDISADLMELASSPVTVITAGAKAILDLPSTLESLETFSVPVLGYRTSEFPAFYSRQSGLRLSMRCDYPSEVANIMRAHRRLGMSSGIVVANPVPEVSEIPMAEIMPHIEEGIEEAIRQGVTGKDLTPFLLKKIAESTKGKSVDTNLALVRNNAAVAAEIAVAYNGIAEKSN